MWQEISPATWTYNCMAFAAEENDRVWWPDPMGLYYWPEKAPREVTIPAFVLAFRTLGYEPATNRDWEPGIQKVALYVDDEGNPTHAARQLEKCGWLSKLGDDIDIIHDVPEDLPVHYGSVTVILKRRAR